MINDKRVSIDCRDFPNETGCTLLISGSPKEVSRAALRHAIEEHGHKDTPELRKQLKAMMKKRSENKLKNKKKEKSLNK